MNKIISIFIMGILLLNSCGRQGSTNVPKNDFITVKEGQFIRNGKPYYYIGTNYWYGALLGSKGKGGNRERLQKELDLMKANGIDNLRILAGAEGPNGEPRRVSPAMQIRQGIYDEDLLKGLDFLLNEMTKRNMVAILFINNAWEWSGGFSQYVSWSTGDSIPYPEVNGKTWGEFMAFSGRFLNDEKAKSMFYKHIEFLLNRKNSINGVLYKEDPTIMTWEIANEPRAFSNENKMAFDAWIDSTATLIKRIDPSHLVTTGLEGTWGCENDTALYEKIHSHTNIDYLTMHIWPYNWSWLNPKDMTGTIDSALIKVGEYMNLQISVAKKLNKPIVFEEFGLPRDGFAFAKGTPVTTRDKYYDFSFSEVLKNAKSNGLLAGANFWTFSGIGKPNADRTDNMWKDGDDFLGDPPQEAQRLNSVCIEDPTMGIVKKYNDSIIGLRK